MMRKISSACLLLLVFFFNASLPAHATQIQVYGAWHCGNDFCTWASVRDMTDFDTKNHWIIDRGDGYAFRQSRGPQFRESSEAPQ